MDGKRYFIDLEINGFSVTMKVDSGCHDSIINKWTWQDMGKPSLSIIQTVRRSATGKEVRLKGGLNVKVHLAGTDHYLSLQVAEGENTRNLIGRKWLPSLMDIDWNIFFYLETVTIRSNVPTRTKNKLKAAVMTRGSKPFTLSMKIQNVEIEMMLDTGATSSIIGQAHWIQLGSPPLDPTSRIMRDTSNNIVDLMGNATSMYSLWVKWQSFRYW